MADEAVAATPRTSTPTSRHLASLGATRYALYQRTGEHAQLEAAVTAGREALEVADEHGPNVAMLRSNLAEWLRQRFLSTGDRADLDEAVELLRRAVDETPREHPDRSGYLSNLGMCLHDPADSRPGELDEAIAVHREAVDGAATVEQATALTQLGRPYAAARR